MQNKSERIDSYMDIVKSLYDGVRAGSEKSKEFKEAEITRARNIQHYANSDMEGKISDEHRNLSNLQKVMNFAPVRFLLSPLATFDQMLRMFGSKNVNGEGYLFNHFMGGWIDANDAEWRNYKKATDVLGEKVSEIFGKKGMKWSDLFNIEKKLPTAEVNFFDGGEVRPHVLTQ